MPRKQVMWSECSSFQDWGEGLEAEFKYQCPPVGVSIKPWLKGFRALSGWWAHGDTGRVACLEKAWKLCLPSCISFPLPLFHLAILELYYFVSPISHSLETALLHLTARSYTIHTGDEWATSSLCSKDGWPSSHQIEFSSPLATVSILQWAQDPNSSFRDFCPSKETSVKIICKVQAQESINTFLINK